jgi:hypothetical protein
VGSVALLLYCSLRDLIDFLSKLYTLNLLSLKIYDSKLYVSFSIKSLGLALSRHYVLSLRKRFGRESALLA